MWLPSERNGRCTLTRKMWREVYRLRGHIDYVAVQADGTKVVVDWKRTRNLEDECNSFSRSMRCPLDDVPDCVLWHYRLQLNVYRYILQHYYSETVSGMYVVGTNPDNPQEPFVDAVPVMEAETAALMETCG